MKRKLLKIITILFVIVMVVGSINNITLATGAKNLVNNFDGGTTQGGYGTSLIEQIIGPILSVVRIVATGISIIMITYLGIQYMSAAPSEKAAIKTKLVTFTVGAAVVIGAVKLLEIAKDTATSIFE